MSCCRAAFLANTHTSTTDGEVMRRTRKPRANWHVNSFHRIRRWSWVKIMSWFEHFCKNRFFRLPPVTHSSSQSDAKQNNFCHDLFQCHETTLNHFFVVQKTVVHPVLSLLTCNGAIFRCCTPKMWSKFSNGYTSEETEGGWRFGLACSIFGMEVGTKIYCGIHSGLQQYGVT